MCALAAPTPRRGPPSKSAPYESSVERHLNVSTVDGGSTKKRSSSRVAVVDNFDLHLDLTEDPHIEISSLPQVQLGKAGGGAGAEDVDDRYSLVTLIMFVHGVGILIPWSSFLTIAQPYFVCYKLRYTLIGNNEESWYSRGFFNFVALASQTPNVALSFFNLFFTLKCALPTRILTSLSAIGSICALTMALIYIDSSSWVSGFFWLTLSTVVLLNGANGVYQNCLYGLAANFPQGITTAVIAGNNACALFTACVAIASLAAASSARTSAMLFFSTSLLIVILCFLSFMFLHRLEFFKHYAAASGAREGFENDDLKRSFSTKCADYCEIFKMGWPQFANVWLVYFVSLSVYPTIQVEFRARDSFVVPPKYFSLVTVFLNFGFFAFIGSLLTSYVHWPSPRYLIALTSFRLLFIPFFLSCNTYPSVRRWPVFVYNEWFFVFANALQAFTTGYCSSLAMIYAPRCVPLAKSRNAGMLAGFMLVFGLCCGVAFTFVEKFV